jgi:antiphage defense system Thoeris ThsB-like protein
MRNPSDISETPLSPKAFFSFSHPEDKNRVDAIYQEWKARHPNVTLDCLDSTVVEQAKVLGDDEVKRAIREAIDQTIVTCVLVGAHTWQDRWVRYELARSLERGSRLLAVRIGGIADPKTRQTTPSGWNPLAYIGIGKGKGGDYLLYENVNGQWTRYQDRAATISKPTYVPDMSVGYVQPLSVGLREYDYMAQRGAEHLPEWIEQAAEST